MAKCKVLMESAVKGLRLKCTKVDYGWGSTPDTAGGAYSTPQLHLRGLLIGEGTEGKERGEKEKGMGGFRALLIPPDVGVLE